MLDFNDAPKQESKPRIKPCDNPIEALRAAAADNGYSINGLVPDGKYHRFAVGNKGLDGWAVADMVEGILIASYGDWKSGRKFTFSSNSGNNGYSGTIQRALEKQIKTSRESRQKIWETTKKIVQEEYYNLSHTDEMERHPYIVNKGINPYGAVRCGKGDALLVPLYDEHGTIWSLQWIYPDGRKRFQTDGRKKGLFSYIQGEGDTLYITEGYSTACSVHEATGATVIIGIDAGNLLPASQTALKCFQGDRIIIAADNDQWTDGNPGITKAKEAASVIGAEVIHPKFADTTGKPTDFNDLHVREGLAAVKKTLQPSKINFYSFKEVFETMVELNPIAEGLFDVGEPVIIFGKGGSGKSMAQVHMALQLAMGEGKLWGKFDIPTSRGSIFLQTENALATMSKRLKKICTAQPEYQEILHRCLFPRINDDIINRGFFNDEAYRREVKSIINEARETMQVDMLMIDPLISFHGEDENDSKIRTCLDYIGDICIEMKVTPVVVHHANKEGNYRGSTAIRDWCRCMIEIREEDDNIRLFRSEKANNYPKFKDFTLRLDPGTLLFDPLSMIELMSDEKRQNIDTVRQALIGLGRPVDVQRDLIRACQEIKKRSNKVYHDAIQDAIKCKIIDMQYLGQVNGQPAHRYSIPSQMDFNNA